VSGAKVRTKVPISVSQLAPALIGLIRPAAKAVGSDIWRRWHINQQLINSNPSKISPVLKKAITDLEVLLGRDSLLTSAAANLLEDLKSTGLLGLIAQNSFYELQDDGVQFQFEVMFARHFSGSGANKEKLCGEFFQKITFLLRESIRAQIDDGLLYIFDTNLKSRSGDINSIENKRTAVVSEIRAELRKRIGLSAQQFLAQAADQRPRVSGLTRDHYPAWLYLSPEELSKRVKIVSSALIPAYEFVRLDGPAQRSYDCEIDKLYIPARLVECEFLLTFNALNILEATEAIFKEKISAANQCVVLGDPGGGKSTLAQRICLDSLRDSSRDGRLPLAVKVELRRFSRRAGVGDFDNLVDFIASEISRQGNLSGTELDLVNFVQHLLFFGRMLIVFDGIDEIVSTPRRREMIAAVQNLSNRFLQNRFVYTCRRTDFLTTPILGKQIFLLLGFNHDEVLAYFRSSSQYVFDRSAEDIANREADFLKQAIEHAHEFIKNPLLLALIVWIYNVGQRIPDNRIELYEECSELLFRRWDSLKEIDPELPDPHWLFQLVTEIAHHLYLLTPDEGESNSTWLRARALEFFKKVYDSDVENRSKAASDRFVRHLIGRSWVLQERSAGIFEFTHRTFLEYYFARWLDDAFDGIDVLFEHVAPRIRLGEWTVPIHLAFQMKAAGKLRSADALTNALIDLLNKARGADEEAEQTRNTKKLPELPNVTQFVVGSIGYLQPSEASIARITKLLASNAKTKTKWFTSIGSIVSSPTEFHNAIAEGVYQALADEIADRKGYTVGFVVDWLYACYLSKRQTHPVVFTGHVLRFGDVQERFGAKFLEQIEKNVETVASLPKMTFDLTGTTVPAVASIGLGMWSASITPDGRLDWRFIDFGLGLIESIDVLLGKRIVSECQYVMFFQTLSSILPKQANYSISGGVTVITPFRIEEIELLGTHLSYCPANVALSFAASAIGYTELASRLGIVPTSKSESSMAIDRARQLNIPPSPRLDLVKKLLRDVSLRSDIPLDFRNFIENWISNKHAMFSPFERMHYTNAKNVFLAEADRAPLAGQNATYQSALNAALTKKNYE